MKQLIHTRVGAALAHTILFPVRVVLCVFVGIAWWQQFSRKDGKPPIELTP